MGVTASPDETPRIPAAHPGRRIPARPLRVHVACGEPGGHRRPRRATLNRQRHAPGVTGGHADRLARPQRHPAVALGGQVQPVLAPDPGVAQHRHGPQVHQRAVMPVGDRPQVHVVDRDLAPNPADDRERARVEPGQHQHLAAGLAQAGHRAVEHLGQQVRVRAGPQQVIAARRDADQLGCHRDGRGQLLIDDLAEQLAAHSQVRVAQLAAATVQVLGEAIRPAEVAARRARIVQPLGEAVP